MISATVFGSLPRDAELRQAGSGKVCAFSVASKSWGKNGDVTTWVSCSYWGKGGEAVAQFLTKGKQVVVSGQMKSREYTDKSGAKKTVLEMNVTDMKLVGGGSGGRDRNSNTDDGDNSDLDDIGTQF